MDKAMNFVCNVWMWAHTHTQRHTHTHTFLYSSNPLNQGYKSCPCVLLCFYWQHSKRRQQFTVDLFFSHHGKHYLQVIKRRQAWDVLLPFKGRCSWLTSQGGRQRDLGGGGKWKRLTNTSKHNEFIRLQATEPGWQRVRCHMDGSWARGR